LVLSRLASDPVRYFLQPQRLWPLELSSALVWLNIHLLYQPLDLIAPSVCCCPIRYLISLAPAHRAPAFGRSTSFSSLLSNHPSDSIIAIPKLLYSAFLLSISLFVAFRNRSSQIPSLWILSDVDLYSGPALEKSSGWEYQLGDLLNTLVRLTSTEPSNSFVSRLAFSQTYSLDIKVAEGYSKFVEEVLPVSQSAKKRWEAARRDYDAAIIKVQQLQKEKKPNPPKIQQAEQDRDRLKQIYLQKGEEAYNALLDSNESADFAGLEKIATYFEAYYQVRLACSRQHLCTVAHRMTFTVLQGWIHVPERPSRPRIAKV
jgi:hypothetical protein